MVASMEDKLNSVKFLIEQGAAVDLQDQKGDTALLYAVMTDEPFFQVVNSLLIAGASRLFNVSGLTPSQCRCGRIFNQVTRNNQRAEM